MRLFFFKLGYEGRTTQWRTKRINHIVHFVSLPKTLGYQKIFLFKYPDEETEVTKSKNCLLFSILVFKLELISLKMSFSSYTSLKYSLCSSAVTINSTTAAESYPPKRPLLPTLHLKQATWDNNRLGFLNWIQTWCSRMDWENGLGFCYYCDFFIQYLFVCYKLLNILFKIGTAEQETSLMDPGVTRKI